MRKVKGTASFSGPSMTAIFAPGGNAGTSVHLKSEGRNKCVSLSRICWRDQEDAKSAQKSGCYCNGLHSFLLRWVSEILRTHGRLQARPAFGGLKIMLRSA